MKLENHVSKSAKDFFDKKGAVELFVFLGESPKRFSELEQKVSISTATLSNRLIEGREAGLIAEKLDSQTEGASKKIYELSDTGQELFEFASEFSLAKKAHDRREIIEDWKQTKSEFMTSITE